MAGIKDLTKLWRTIGEFELKPIEKEATLPLKIALVGAPGAGRHTLAGQMRNDPNRPNTFAQSPLLILDLENTTQTAEADLTILVLDSMQGPFDRQRSLARQLADNGHKVLVLFNKLDLLNHALDLDGTLSWGAARVLYGSAKDIPFLLNQFAPAMLELLVGKRLALGRQFPLFRLLIANNLIAETSFSNATYAFSTGLASTVPVLDIPLNVTDLLILTKAQAFLVYRLGLLFGFSTRWQDYVAEFGSVIGGGFLWRQLARQLVGLIPVWGILPKVAVSYAGTYVVGQTILQWYLTGRHISKAQINALYRQALIRGQENAKRLLARSPRLPRLPALPKISLKRKPKRSDASPLPELITAPNKFIEVAENEPMPRACPFCNKVNAPDAQFCQYCGQNLTLIQTDPAAGPEIPLEE